MRPRMIINMYVFSLKSDYASRLDVPFLDEKNLEMSQSATVFNVRIRKNVLAAMASLFVPAAQRRGHRLDRWVQYDAQKSAALKCLLMAQHAGSTFSDLPSPSPLPCSYFTPLLRFRDWLHSGRVSCDVL
ncbi:hypothetical protein EVAR_46257_1 [Eumeta japonica]|uniref:Uncharacterized protein n=1 Tax=Eumeta variegata TaxID=151549 RepID=A0A4C1Y9B1_EUMVA|nr:hypothetical protein EVAR_46257_1 [Eumeta japonica]